jgi:ABC-type branched-subunit amino acid transport system ATPase component/ABC-type branched-subunit amino acid transport system permease subunit
MVPIWLASDVVEWSQGLIDIMLMLSLGLLVRRSGQISLCQLAFAAVGAAAFGHFANDHVPWLLALVLATLVAIPVGALVAIPAVRLSGVFLALATLGLGILIQEVFYTRSYMFGSSTLGIVDPRPNVSLGSWHLSSDKGFYYLLLIMVVLVVVTVTAISNGRLGRLLEAMADSPLALETQGATSSVLKVIVFCITAAMASTAGAFTGMLYHYAIGTYFNPFDSLTFLVLVVIVTIGDPWYAVIGALSYTVLPIYIHGAQTSNYLLLLFGISACLVGFSTKMGGMPEGLRRFLDRLGGRRVPVTASLEPAPAVGAKAATSPSSAVVPDHRLAATSAGPREGLSVEKLAVHFGGVRAVNGVSLQAPTGRVTGLIGPNGAGKTTTFNACNGLVKPTSGQISVHAVDIRHKGAAHRARLGMGRTFQRTELFNSLTVRQNVAMGREAPLAGANPLAQVFSSRSAARLIDQAADEAMALAGITAIGDTQVGLLPIGQRRLVELARVLAGPFDMLLLDEPSSGLDGRETSEFGRVLREVVAQRGCGILLVEHDMTLVRDVCDYVYVLDFGSLIFEGTPDEMQRSDLVRAAYLGGGDSIAVSVGEDGAPEDGRDPLPTGE